MINTIDTQICIVKHNLCSLCIQVANVGQGKDEVGKVGVDKNGLT